MFVGGDDRLGCAGPTRQLSLGQTLPTSNRLNDHRRIHLFSISDCLCFGLLTDKDSDTQRATQHPWIQSYERQDQPNHQNEEVKGAKWWFWEFE
jgi:hypothetical protein